MSEPTISQFPTPIPVLRRIASRLCDAFAEENNIPTDTLWERLVAADNPPDCLTFRPYDEDEEPELDTDSQLLWDAIQRLKGAEAAEVKRLVSSPT